MTLEEAIDHCLDVANECEGECGEQHMQLAKWLTELLQIYKIKNYEH